jgi:hypothetical protein
MSDTFARTRYQIRWRKAAELIAVSASALALVSLLF